MTTSAAADHDRARDAETAWRINQIEQLHLMGLGGRLTQYERLVLRQLLASSEHAKRQIQVADARGDKIGEGPPRPRLKLGFGELHVLNDLVKRFLPAQFAMEAALDRVMAMGRASVVPDASILIEQRIVISELLDYAEKFAAQNNELPDGDCLHVIRRGSAWFETGSATIDPAEVIQELVEYVERYADQNDEPEGGDCRVLLARITPPPGDTQRPRQT